MVNVKSVIFFGKSEKNIWVLDFFNYNHWYRISKTAKQQNRWNSITAKTVITVWNGITVITVITAITCNSRADTTAITWNGITAEQIQQLNTWNRYNVKQYHRLNRTTAKQHKTISAVWSNINGRMGNEPNYTHYQNSMRCV